jgi:L-amino acid N-acyltransferase
MRIRDAEPADLPRILEITNDAILNTTAIWSLAPASLASRQAWFAERQRQGYPVLVAEDSAGRVLGFASFGDFRPWEGYRHTVEHSIYVEAAARRQGLGRALLTALIARTEQTDKHVMIGGIEAQNSASLRLHQQLGFEQVGQLRQVGRKFDRWLDLVFVQRFVGTEPPCNPAISS